jgi:malonyl-CoA decarboxylase
MSLFSGLLGSLFDRTSSWISSQKQTKEDITLLCDQLLSTTGEARGQSLAHDILDKYAILSDDQKKAFFLYLRHQLDLDISASIAALSSYEASPDSKTYSAVHAATEPQRLALFTRLNTEDGATERLVRMRADILAQLPEMPELAPVAFDLQQLFISWFNRGFLVLRPISWQSPAHILEKIIAYEAVHSIDSWDALRLRLAPADRRCFAFFHPAMPDEPLIFVEIALTDHIPHSIQDILADDRPVLNDDAFTTATFYSISNCQKGLAGISFGNSLIKTVVRELSADMKAIKQFVTLSPIPGLAKWVASEGIHTDGLADAEKMPALTAQYLCHAKRPDGQPADPVARFHLNNGALIHAVHQHADTASLAQKQSFGMMVNYLYHVPDIEQNHEKYADGKVVTAAAIQALAKKYNASE